MPKAPINSLIFQTAGELAAAWVEVAFNDPNFTRGKYVGLGDKPVRMFVKDHIEKFIPLAITYLIRMLKSTSNCTEHMRREIYKALMDPINDPDLMASGRNNTQEQHENMIQKAIKDFDKRKVFTNLSSKDLKNSTALH